MAMAVVVMLLLPVVVVLVLKLVVLGWRRQQARPANFTHPKLRHNACPKLE